MYACLVVPGNLELGIECARAFSPHIEENQPDTVLFDARGLESLFGPPAALANEIARRIGVPASIALAANTDAALYAARGLRGITVITPGHEPSTLAPLPLNLLPCPPQTAELLHLWGLRKFADLAALPPLGVAARLGDAGIHLQRLARGEATRQLRPLKEPFLFEAALELDYPVELLDALCFILSRLLQDVCAQLTVRALATNQLTLRLTLERAPEHMARLRLPVPMLDPAAFLKMLQLELSGRPPAAPVVKVWLRADPVKPRRLQHGLFLPPSPEPEKLEVTVARVRHLVGEGRVGSPELADTHRPDSFFMRHFGEKRGAPGSGSVTAVAVAPAATFSGTRLCLRRFRPPRYAQVLIVNQQPVRVASQTVNGRVVVAKGPWRTSGEWWQTTAWHRDEWDVALEFGTLYRLFRELDSGRWFIEGSYD